MFLATANQMKKLLHLSYIGQVRAEDIQQGWKDVQALLSTLPSGFHLLTDLERLESMELACATEIGRIMELCKEKQVGMVVRVVPDPKKDIGLNILSLFHYGRRLHAHTCETMKEAGQLLSL
jgi:hypothetical protein